MERLTMHLLSFKIQLRISQILYPVQLFCINIMYKKPGKKIIFRRIKKTTD